MAITIYGITTDDEYATCGFGLDDDDPYTRYNYEGWVTSDADNRKLAEELSQRFNGFVGSDEEGRWYLEFTQINIDAYFVVMRMRLMEAASKVEQLTADDLKKYCSDVIKVGRIYSDDYGDMIYEPENGWLTPQEFMRFVRPGKRYYVYGAAIAR